MFQIIIVMCVLIVISSTLGLILGVWIDEKIKSRRKNREYKSRLRDDQNK